MESIHNELLSQFFIHFKDSFERYSDYLSHFQKKVMDSFHFEYFSGYYLPIVPFLIPLNAATNFSKKFCGLIAILQSITERFFCGDWSQHAQYLGISQRDIETLRKFESFERSFVLARPDIIVTHRGIKVIETNIDSGIGHFGNTHLLFEFHNNNPAFESFKREMKIDCFIPDPIQSLAQYLSNLPQPIFVIKSKVSDHQNHTKAFINIQNDQIKKILPSCFSQYTKSKDELIKGLSKAGTVFRNISPYQFFERFDEDFLDMNRFFQQDSRYLECSPFSILLENKLNLALISDELNWGKFNHEEIDIIREVVPWTRRLTPEIASYISLKKDRYVIKKGSGRASIFLCVGKDVSRSVFDQWVRRALQEKDWVAQEFLNPLLFYNLFLNGSRIEMFQIPFVGRFFMIDQKYSGMYCATAVIDDGKSKESYYCNSAGYGKQGACLVSHF